MRKFALLLVAFALLSLVAAACASNGSQPTQQPTQSSSRQPAATESQQSSGKVTIPGTDGKSVTIDSNAPAELKSLPVPAGFTSQGFGSMTSGGDSLSTGTWTGSGSVQTVVDFYKSQLTGQGWKEEGTFLSDSGGLLNYSKPGGLGLTLTVSKDDSGKVTVAALYGKSSATPTPKPTAAKESAAEPTDTPEKSSPQATSTPAAPALGNSANIPDELKAIPLPPGFAVEKDGTMRLATGGKFQMATAQFFGTASVKDALTFFKANLPSKGWTIDAEMGGDDSATLICKNANDQSLALEVSISAKDAGTEVVLALTDTQQ